MVELSGKLPSSMASDMGLIASWLEKPVLIGGASWWWLEVASSSLDVWLIVRPITSGLVIVLLLSEGGEACLRLGERLRRERGEVEFEDFRLERLWLVFRTGSVMRWIFLWFTML